MTGTDARGAKAGWSVGFVYVCYSTTSHETHRHPGRGRFGGRGNLLYLLYWVGPTLGTTTAGAFRLVLVPVPALGGG